MTTSVVPFHEAVGVLVVTVSGSGFHEKVPEDGPVVDQFFTVIDVASCVTTSGWAGCEPDPAGAHRPARFGRSCAQMTPIKRVDTNKPITADLRAQQAVRVSHIIACLLRARRSVLLNP